MYKPAPQGCLVTRVMASTTLGCWKGCPGGPLPRGHPPASSWDTRQWCPQPHHGISLSLRWLPSGYSTHMDTHTSAQGARWSAAGKCVHLRGGWCLTPGSRWTCLEKDCLSALNLSVHAESLSTHRWRVSLKATHPVWRSLAAPEGPQRARGKAQCLRG